MSWISPRAVPTDLADDFVTGWTARVEGTHRLVPDGCVDVLWISNGTVWVCGPETSAWTFTLPPGTEAVGLRFRPGRAGSVLGFATPELRNERVQLADLIGGRSGRLIVDQVGSAPAPAAKLGALQRYARSWVAAAPSGDVVARAVTSLLRQDIATPVSALSSATGLSERQLHRRCVAAFGYGPALLRRILRLQRFRRLAGHPAAPADLAGLAVLAGYTDQAHLSHECRAIAGVSPRVLLGR
jgi:AraC-like DNA-binding protein